MQMRTRPNAARPVACRTPGCGRTVTGKGYVCITCAPPTCATCGLPLLPNAQGWFCSYACDTTERGSRVVDKLVAGLRRLLP